MINNMCLYIREIEGNGKKERIRVNICYIRNRISPDTSALSWLRL